MSGNLTPSAGSAAMNGACAFPSVRSTIDPKLSYTESRQSSSLIYSRRGAVIALGLERLRLDAVRRSAFSPHRDLRF
jgi:hypothetical protein